MSKIAIIGATGRAGSQLLEEALRRGHTVIAIARNTDKLAVRPGVTVKQVDALDAEALQHAISGSDVVISAAHFATLPASAVIGPVKKAGVKRLLVVGGAGSLLLPGGGRVIDSEGFPAEYKAEASAGAQFLENTKKQMESGGVPPEKAAKLTVFLLSEASAGITGKFISAPWDPWEDPACARKLRGDKDYATLRRIDDMGFGKRRTGP